MSDGEQSAVAVLVTLVLYKAVLVAVGVWASRRSRDGADYILGGRALGPWVAAVSASASSSSAWSLLGVSGAAYAWGLGAFWLFPACVGGFALNWFVLAPAVRRHSHDNNSLTLTELLAGDLEPLWRRRFEIVASLIILVSLSTYVASQFQGAGKTFYETFDVSLELSIVLGATVVVLYTLLGGFWAVSVTDTVQGLLMAVVAVVLPAVALTEVGGPAALLQGMRALDVDGFASFTRGAEGAAALGFVMGLLGVGLGYPGQPHVVNRLMALRDERATTVARRIAMGWAMVVYAGMLVLGWAGRILFTQLRDQEVVFIAAANELFPPVVSGVVLAAVLSAIMSTADSQLLVAASSVTHDLRIGAASRWDLARRSRLAVVILSLVAVVVALVGSAEIFSKVLFAWTAMGAAFGPLVLVRMSAGPIRGGYALGAMVTGFCFSVAAYWIPWSQGTWLERVLPFVLAGLLAYRGRQRRWRS